MTLAICAEHISKAYQRQGTERENQYYRTLREDLMRALTTRRTKRETFLALDDVSFEARQGDVIGVIGRNGSGKSTLLKVLSRITRPTTGRVRWRGRIGSLLEVGTGFHPELTGRENVYLVGAVLGMRRAEVRAKFDEIVAFSEVEDFLDMPVKRYSSGMFVRLAFAVAAHLDPEILLIDEVLAVGDAAFRAKCIGRMGEAGLQGRTVVFVSHSMSAVAQVCHSAILLQGGCIASRGSVADVIEDYERSVSAATEGNAGRARHVLYERAVAIAGEDFAVTRLSVLDHEGRPKPTVSTWDTVVVRVEFTAARVVRNGAVMIELAAKGGAHLLRIANEPDGGWPMSFHQGENVVECVITRLPFAAGSYNLGVGLVVPQVEDLWYKADIARLEVSERDVYDSGHAPALPRSAVAVEHSWRRA